MRADARTRAPTVVITGAAGGIGAALARRFARDGARLALLDRDAAPLESLATALEDEGKPARALPCDVTDAEQCETAIREVESTFGGIDVLVNNAGITHIGRVGETRTEVLRRVMEVNYFGAVHCTSAALQSLVERRGRIVVLSSVAGFAPLATRAGYAASKHALHGFFDSLRAEYRDEGLEVMLVCPSFVDTGIGDRALAPDGRLAGAGARTGVGTTLLAPEAVADAIARGLKHRKRLLLLGREAQLAFAATRIAPRFYERRMVQRVLGGMRTTD